MSKRLVQIARREGRIDRVPHGQVPVIELTLVDEQYVAWVELTNNRYAAAYDIDRKTVDWSWTAYVVTPL